MRIADEIKYRNIIAGGPGSGRHAGLGSQIKEKLGGLFHTPTAGPLHSTLVKHGFKGPYQGKSSASYSHPASGSRVFTGKDGWAHHTIVPDLVHTYGTAITRGQDANALDQHLSSYLKTHYTLH